MNNVQRLASCCRGNPARLLAAGIGLLVLVAFSGTTTPVQAASGDMLRSIVVQPAPSCSYFSAGIAFDGTDLLISCVTSNVITRVRPSDGANLGTIAIQGITEGIAAMSWDRENRQLWVGTGYTQPAKVYTAILDKTLGTGTATLQFSHPSDGSPLDGLAFDPTDNTVWLGPDGQNTIYHYSATGAPLGSFDVTGAIRSTSPFATKSGIVVGSATKLYIANDGGEQIFSINKDGSSPALFAAVPSGKRVEDLECDTVTFAPRAVIWSNYSFDNHELNAYEVPAGDCSQGADLSITQTAFPNPPSSGHKLTYTLAIANIGPANATSVIITDTLPGGATLSSATSSFGTCTGTTTVTCNLGGLAPSTHTAVTLVVIPPSQPGTMLTNTASLTGAQPDPNSNNNTSTLILTVSAPGSPTVLSQDDVLQTLALMGATLCVQNISVAAAGGPPAILLALATPQCAGTILGGGLQALAVVENCLLRNPPNPACANLLAVR